ncbi:murein hydrolase activator EnvC [Psychromonas sp. 14N.309.X.WAT.B.A12]|uniref:murein hydrolase activator EnvC family protein n=1 Tax=unclassified Psychromonas TaxID=2614957 RepID=UPI0025B0F225|nr:peptidoglycan DD-metalloendopeptidase family protein [Psychromonas sp. 14N.309.X.WAT.B.A12]MDN2664569.1 peptidoglycan DD-metalloendopeptidase family protein [Psychromonas sp. 14N.309.X.WAT.B.A12]
MFNLSNDRKLSYLAFIAFFITVLFSQTVTAANLNTIQRQIKENQQTKAQQEKQQKQLENELEKSEKAVASIALTANQTKTEIEQQRTALVNLQKETKQLNEDKAIQQSLLQQQLVSAYMTGENDLVKLILNQEDLSKVVRARSYYKYLNDARLESIESLHETEQKLLKNQESQTKTLASLEKLYEQQKQRQASLTAEKSKRDKALQALRKDINYQSNKIAKLNNSEKALRARLKKAAEERKRQQIAAAKIAAAKALKNKNIAKAKAQAEAEAATQATANNQANRQTKTNSKLASLKGKLKWPIEGKVLHRFGSARSSQVKWKGIAIATNEGEKVRAVATGRVLFAGYFKGYGMVIALDHSDNYITLYGYNQTLLYKAGDVVLEGDAIALAGHSGGQERNTLYFELSHKGTAEDPLRWLSRR